MTDLVGIVQVGQLVRLEHTRGWATSNPVTETVQGEAEYDDEGTLRVAGVNITQDADGYFPTGVLILSVSSAL